MEQEKKKKWIWIIAAILVLLVILWWAFRTSDFDFSNTNQDNANQPPEFVPPSVNLEYQPPEVPAQTNTEFNITNLAKNYAARFGSWSTDSDGYNLEELLPLSSSSMQAYLKGIDTESGSEDFSGVTTKSLSAKIQASSDSSATVMVGTQRIETRADLSTDTYYQDIEIKVIKVGDTWLVNAANWQ